MNPYLRLLIGWLVYRLVGWLVRIDFISTTVNVPIGALISKKFRHLEFFLPEVGIYKRKQESKKTRKQEYDQESDREKKKVFFLVEFLLSCFLL